MSSIDRSLRCCSRSGESAVVHGADEVVRRKKTSCNRRHGAKNIFRARFALVSLYDRDVIGALQESTELSTGLAVSSCSETSASAILARQPLTGRMASIQNGRVSASNSGGGMLDRVNLYLSVCGSAVQSGCFRFSFPPRRSLPLAPTLTLSRSTLPRLLQPHSFYFSTSHFACTLLLPAMSDTGSYQGEDE